VRVLLSAYACEPERGSEPGVGWSWAVELARLGHQVTVITRAANRRLIQPDPMSSSDALSFIYYDLPHWAQAMRRGGIGKALYYILWQWFAMCCVRRLYPALEFDIVHHVTYVSVRLPSFMGSLGIPFWFGPVSGGETVPSQLRAGFSAGQRWRERLRDLSNFFIRLDPLMRGTFSKAERILVTRDTLKLIPPRWRHKCRVQLAIGASMCRPYSTRRPNIYELRLLYVGRLLEWKGVDIALYAFAQLRQSHPNLYLSVIGDGPERERLERLSRELGLEHAVRWLGWQPHEALTDHYAAADILLFPSLRDSGGMAVLEALSNGIPVICTDLGGPGLLVNESCGRAIATAGRDPRQLASEMAGALTDIAASPDLLESLSRGARVRARRFEFSHLVESLYPAAKPNVLKA
jgi:glycosyltransferase involved in cell wall biosynthesis